ncbi:DUF4935 domain-containing protein [Oxalobacteraceae sp. CFBP 8755]|nr:DUF4935 domain-containing protein [Oxalobacteraceae sp. CFBP 8755]
MMHLFIDTNIFLNFYSFEGDKLLQLSRLMSAIDTGAIKLHLPQHVLNELARNREQKIKIANDQFIKEPMQTAIPRHMQSYAQSEEYQHALETAKELRKKLVNLAVADASNHSLEPDLLLKQLFEKAVRYEEDAATFALAIQRMQKGNPPGKGASVGDQYNWEKLLLEVPSIDLHIVSKDGDYASLLNKSLPHPFLKSEWNARKGADLHIFSELKSFLDRYDQTIAQPIPEPGSYLDVERVDSEIARSNAGESSNASERGDENENEEIRDSGKIQVVNGNFVDFDGLYAAKVAAVDSLVDSRSFAQTHSTIAKLKYYLPAINDTDAERLLNAAVSNDQVRWVATDSDIYSFFSRLLLEHPLIDSSLFREAVDLFGLNPEPFN